MSSSIKKLFSFVNNIEPSLTDYNTLRVFHDSVGVESYTMQQMFASLAIKHLGSQIGTDCKSESGFEDLAVADKDLVQLIIKYTTKYKAKIEILLKSRSK